MGWDCCSGRFVLGLVCRWVGLSLGWICRSGGFVVRVGLSWGEFVQVRFAWVCFIGVPNNACSMDLLIIIYLLREGIFQILQTFSQGKCGAGRLPIFISTESNQSQREYFSFAGDCRHALLYFIFSSIDARRVSLFAYILRIKHCLNLGIWSKRSC